MSRSCFILQTKTSQQIWCIEYIIVHLQRQQVYSWVHFFYVREKKQNTSCREAPKINKYVKQKKTQRIWRGFGCEKRPIPSKCWQWSTLSHCSPLEQHRVPPHPTTTTTITKTSVSEAHRRPRRRTPLFCKWTTTLLHTQNPLTRHYTHG